MSKDENRKCKYEGCSYYDPKATHYCCDACSSDAYDSERLHGKTARKLWKRINKYIFIKWYLSKDLMQARRKHVGTKMAYEQYIVNICVRDIEDLSDEIDGSGLSKAVAPPTIIRELFDLCVAVNPGFSFDSYLASKKAAKHAITKRTSKDKNKINIKRDAYYVAEQELLALGSRVKQEDSRAVTDFKRIATFCKHRHKFTYHASVPYGCKRMKVPNLRECLLNICPIANI